MMLETPETITSQYVLQVTLTYRKATINRIGSFHVFKKAGWFGHADQLLKWCPHGACTGLISDNFKLTPAQVKEIGEENIQDTEKWPVKYRALYENWYGSPTICPKCNQICKSIETLPDSYGFQLPDDRIAKKMAQMFRELGGDADVYLVRNKYFDEFRKSKENRHDNTTTAAQRQIRAEANMQKIRNSREKVFYPLKSIIKDSAGGDVASHFKFLLGA